MLLNFLLDERGVTAVEYSLIGVLVVVGAIAAFDRMGEELKVGIYDIIEASSGHL